MRKITELALTFALLGTSPAFAAADQVPRLSPSEDTTMTEFAQATAGRDCDKLQDFYSNVEPSQIADPLSPPANLRKSRSHTSSASMQTPPPAMPFRPR